MRVLFAFVLLLFVLPGHGQSVALKKPSRTLFSLKAVDSKTEAVISAQFSVTAIQARKVFTSPSTSSFNFVLTQTDTLDVLAMAPGYHEAEELMVVSCDTCHDYEYIIKLDRQQPTVSPERAKTSPTAKPDTVFRNLAVNQSFQLDDVYFEQSTYTLRPESYPQLDKLVKTLQTVPQLKILVVGHTDNVGDRRLNQALSENRASVIRAYLARHGIAESRLRVHGFGDTQPIAPNDSEANKQKNRRVEFVVLAM
ncbi:OmpA family protein [Spirosoma rhododendri]|uniref:OmpA family protein n=1 Tax=Spirosoma rhododendri TaxID=2728024 RepID=A0A7L5DTD5_9BACT|nr:OmpA family protein [Spirosoma rhododendri]QJD79237.1 OmpA family protein [Spirosoma rhododendri]